MRSTRRKFFRTLAGEILTFAHEFKGIPQMRLNELHLLSDEIIKTIIPVFIKDGSYKLHENRLMRYNKESKLYENIDSLNEQKLFVLQSFNEKNTLDEIALEFSERFELDKEVAYQQVKASFIEFAKIMVCHPKNAHL